MIRRLEKAITGAAKKVTGQIFGLRKAEPKTILLVEDSEADLIVVKRFIRKWLEKKGLVVIDETEDRIIFGGTGGVKKVKILIRRSPSAVLDYIAAINYNLGCPDLCFIDRDLTGQGLMTKDNVPRAMYSGEMLSKRIKKACKTCRTIVLSTQNPDEQRMRHEREHMAVDDHIEKSADGLQFLQYLDKHFAI